MSPLWLLTWPAIAVPLVFYVRIRQSIGRPIVIDGDPEVMPLMMALFWPLSLPIAVAIWMVSVVFGDLPAVIAQAMLKREEKRCERIADAVQPPLGPHRTPRCEACGKAYGDAHE